MADGVGHVFDDDGVCERCGFDGAEWVWWRSDTYEGRASDVVMPACRPQNAAYGVDSRGKLKI